MYARAAKVYRQVDLESASKSQVLDRLYLRAIRDCQDAGEAIDSKDIALKANSINHATRIVVELMAALDYETAPELCGNLSALYDYVLDRLTQANMKNDKEMLEQAVLVLSQLRDAFLEAQSVAA